MKVALLGGASPAGARLAALLRESGWAHLLQVRPQDPASAAVLREVDAVVDCAPDARRPAARAVEWMEACAATPGARLVVLGSAQVYGAREGRIDESAPLRGRAGRAWRPADTAARAYAAAGGRVVVLRAGPLWGAGHPEVRRLAGPLQARRLGDLGVHGDGWSNLVPVDDACLAIVRALQLPLQPGELRHYNLAAPDSPRWNEVFVDLGLALGATPVARIPGWRTLAQQWLAAPVSRALRGIDATDATWPAPARGWRLQQRLDATAATLDLCLDWTPYAAVLDDVAAWEVRQDSLSRARSPWVPGRRRQSARPGA